MFLNVCKRTFHISCMCISWKVKSCEIFNISISYDNKETFLCIAASILPSLNEGMRKNFPLFSSSPHLDFEINFPPGTSATISALKMSQIVQILISDLVVIVNQYGQGKHRVSTRISKIYFLKQKVFLKKQCQFVYNFQEFSKSFHFFWIVIRFLYWDF